jgi:hypothetical protein
MEIRKLNSGKKDTPLLGRSAARNSSCDRNRADFEAAPRCVLPVSVPCPLKINPLP